MNDFNRQEPRGNQYHVTIYQGSFELHLICSLLQQARPNNQPGPVTHIQPNMQVNMHQNPMQPNAIPLPQQNFRSYPNIQQGVPNQAQPQIPISHGVPQQHGLIQPNQSRSNQTFQYAPTRHVRPQQYRPNPAVQTHPPQVNINSQYGSYAPYPQVPMQIPYYQGAQMGLVSIFEFC